LLFLVLLDCRDSAVFRHSHPGGSRLARHAPLHHPPDPGDARQPSGHARAAGGPVAPGAQWLGVVMLRHMNCSLAGETYPCLREGTAMPGDHSNLLDHVQAIHRQLAALAEQVAALTEQQKTLYTLVSQFACQPAPAEHSRKAVQDTLSTQV